jgi:hypothetical protein
MADQHHLAQVERLDDGLDVAGQGVEVVAAARIAGAAMAAAIEGDAAQAVAAQGHHLVAPGARRHRPAADKQDRPGRSRVF